MITRLIGAAGLTVTCAVCLAILFLPFVTTTAPGFGADAPWWIERILGLPGRSLRQILFSSSWPPFLVMVLWLPSGILPWLRLIVVPDRHIWHIVASIAHLVWLLVFSLLYVSAFVFTAMVASPGVGAGLNLAAATAAVVLNLAILTVMAVQAVRARRRSANDAASSVGA